ncbi:MAG: M23 family metallopeptidase, partial [candidate division KSB1 bacterium]|nr:M23 family metallopeptidase [candidate division KSB1 bacterium]
MLAKTFKAIATLAVILAFAAPSALTQYAWPIEPLHESHEITGTFCEYRDTGSAPHFHNAVDIPKPDGQPVYSVTDGRVTAMARSGYNAYVRVQNFAYVHIKPSPALSIGDSVYAGKTVLGTIYPSAGHVHFVDGYVGSERQPLRQNGGLTPYVDPWPPVIKTVRFLLGPTGQEFTGRRISGPVEITFRVREANGPPGTLESRL